MTQWHGALCALALSVSACRVPVDLDAVPIAKASCEVPTEDLTLPDERMLPGRICQQCHTRGGQGHRFLWTASGTVFSNTTVPCNTGGVEGATVEILDKDGNFQTSMTTNSAGNFYTSDPIVFPIRTRITLGATVRQMVTPASLGSCASCHQKEPQNGAPGPIYLNL